MSIKTGFALGVALFLIFILFKNQIYNDALQILFAIMFVLSEVIIITLVARKLK